MMLTKRIMRSHGLGLPNFENKKMEKWTYLIQVVKNRGRCANLTLCLPVSSADNLCKLFGRNVGPDLDPNCLTLL